MPRFDGANCQIAVGRALLVGSNEFARHDIEVGSCVTIQDHKDVSVSRMSSGRSIATD